MLRCKDTTFYRTVEKGELTVKKKFEVLLFWQIAWNGAL
jgi:hypothetical protein